MVDLLFEHEYSRHQRHLPHAVGAIGGPASVDIVRASRSAGSAPWNPDHQWR
jgi:hypothetical protein